MKLEELVSKYVRNAERVLTQMEVSQDPLTVDREKVMGAIEAAKRYLEDAKYYQGRKNLETSLASVAYCEGLLDGLRFLGAVEFSW